MAADTFPFGKHKGERFDQLPVDYIRWCLENMEGLRPPLQAALTAELRRRETSEPGAAPVRQDQRQAPPPATRPTTARPEGRPVDSGNGNGSSPASVEARVRRIVRQELAALLKRAAVAMEKE